MKGWFARDAEGRWCERRGTNGVREEGGLAGPEKWAAARSRQTRGGSRAW